MKLKRATIHKYRNVAPGTTLEFSGGINILLGQNGTGKTNLLKLISMMTRGVFHTLDREEFSVEYELYGAGLSVFIERSNKVVEERPFLPEVLMRDAGREYQPFCRVVIDDGVRRQDAQSKSDGSPPLRMGGSLVLSCYIDSLLQMRKGVTEFSAIIGAGRFDEALRYFDLLTDNFMKSREEVPELEFQVVLTETVPIVRSVGYFSILAPSLRMAILLRLSETPESERIAVLKQVSLRHDGLTSSTGETSFLDMFTQIARIQRAEIEPRMSRFQDAVGDSSDPQGYQPAFATFDALSFNLKVSDTLTVRHDALSYGQKRLLAFLYYLECCTDVVIADELINGMHHEWIEKCVEQIGARQAFLTSQNPLLLDYLVFEDSEEVRQRFVLCDVSSDRWGWRNMTTSEAEEFYRAYRVGIQSVGEILRLKGLW